MNTDIALDLVKARLGITSMVRDLYLQEIIKGIVEELNKVQGLSLKDDSSLHLMFVVDYATWRYQNRDSMEGMPRHIQFRLHNLVIHAGGAKNDV